MSNEYSSMFCCLACWCINEWFVCFPFMSVCKYFPKKYLPGFLMYFSVLGNDKWNISHPFYAKRASEKVKYILEWFALAMDYGAQSRIIFMGSDKPKKSFRLPAWMQIFNSSLSVNLQFIPKNWIRVDRLSLAGEQTLCYQVVSLTPQH